MRALLVEDSDDDGELIRRELSRAGFDLTIRRVETPDELERALVEEEWDIVLSDYTMPRFSGRDALAIVQRSPQRDLPFVMVSGSIGEESAVAALKAGVSNYLMKDKLHRLSRMVERELEDAQVRRERREAFRALEQAVRARDEFLSIASHELKTPLTSLRLQVQGLLHVASRDDGPLLGNDQVLRRLAVIERNADRLTNLIDRLLDISRITTGPLRLHREHVDLVRIARDVVASMAHVFREAGCEVSIEAPPSLIGYWDRDRLEHVVGNLLENAAKYGAGKPIEVIIESRPEHARLHVIDHGIGIGVADQERVFGRFERAVPEKHYGGFGVGLWLTKQIVEAHGGRIEVCSRPGEGSTFGVMLPHPEAT